MTDARHVAARVVIAAIAVVVMGGLGGCAQPAATVAVATHSHDFRPDTLAIPAEQSVKVVYRNVEAGTEHNIAVYERAGGELIARSENVVGPVGVTEFVLPPMAAGTYFIVCDIHPFMTARLEVRAHDRG
jgi:plastocyanin